MENDPDIKLFTGCLSSHEQSFDININKELTVNENSFNEATISDCDDLCLDQVSQMTQPLEEIAQLTSHQCDSDSDSIVFLAKTIDHEKRQSYL